MALTVTSTPDFVGLPLCSSPRACHCQEDRGHLPLQWLDAAAHTADVNAPHDLENHSLLLEVRKTHHDVDVHYIMSTGKHAHHNNK